MSDAHLMDSADAAAAADAARRVQAVLDERWLSVAGPPCAYALFRQQQGPDTHANYVALCGGLVLDPCSNGRALQIAHRSLSALVEWLPDQIDQLAEIFSRSVTTLRSDPRANCFPPPFTGAVGLPGLPFPIEPQAWSIVWRSRVEFVKLGSRWTAFGRFAFIPKTAWLLEFGDDGYLAEGH
jgi:hypothetical protein